MTPVLPWLLIAVAVLSLLGATIRIRRGRTPQTRPLNAFDDLPHQLGYSAESGAPLLFALGTGAIGSERTLASLAALETLRGLADAAVAYSAPPLVAVGDPTLLPLAEDILRRAWARRGFPERYNPTLVRFIGVHPLAYAAGVADMLKRERIHAHVLVGSMDEEAAFMTHAASGQELPQSIAVDRLPALGALYPADAQLAVGEELYAGPARVTGFPQYLGSLQAQDILRFLVILLIFLKALGIW